MDSSLTPFASTPMYDSGEIRMSSFDIPEEKEKLPDHLATEKINTVMFVRMLNDNETAPIIWNRQPALPALTGCKYERVGVIADSNCLFHCVLKATSEVYNQSYICPSTITEEKLVFYETEVDKSVRFIGNGIFDKNRSNIPATVYKILDLQGFKKTMELWRMSYASKFRRHVADKIRTDIAMQRKVMAIMPGSFNMYSELYKDKHLSATQLWEIIFQNMSNELLSRDHLPVQYFVILGEYSNFDVYIMRDRDLIDVNSKDSILYGGDIFHRFVRGPQVLRKMTDPNLHERERKSIIIMSCSDNHYELIGKVYSQGEQKKAILRHNPDDPLVQLLYQLQSNGK